MAAATTPFLQSALEGDEAALLGLLRAVRPDVRRYARATCRAADVDDAVQETLWLVYRRVGDTPGRVVLFGLAVRDRAARVPAPRPDARRSRLGTPRRGTGGALSRTDEALRLDLAAAIQSLPEHYRRIVIMRDLDECTVDEMAAALGTSREAVKGRLHRARIMLREYLLQ